jgi:uncharacterized protein
MKTSGSDTERTRAIATEAFEAWQRGGAPVAAIFAPELTWTVEGRSAASGTYGSAAEFIEKVLAPFAARFAEGEPFRLTELRAVHADGDTAIVIWDGKGVANDGIPYENSYVWVMKFAGDKVVNGVTYYDSIAFDELWNRVEPA